MVLKLYKIFTQFTINHILLNRSHSIEEFLFYPSKLNITNSYLNMRKHHFLAAVICLLFLYSCEKETIAPLIETTQEFSSPLFQIDTVEDLEALEKNFNQEGATSRSSMQVIRVPGGSKNAIQAAIQAAGPFGLVVLDKGKHYEDETILITQPVFIRGQKGASIISSSRLIDEVGYYDPLFFISHANRVTIWGVEMQGKSTGGGLAIATINSTRTVVANNTIHNFQTSLAVAGDDKTLLWRNNIVGIPRSITGEIINATGIGVANSKDTRIIQNKISSCVYGIVVSDKNGKIHSNELYRNAIGVVLGFIPPVVPTADGTSVGSTVPATNWTVQSNYAHDNFNWGYVVSNGANNNQLIQNRGGNNRTGDLILDQESVDVFGLPSPTSFNNFVDAQYNKTFTIYDCGNNNEVIGGLQLPCN